MKRVVGKGLAVWIACLALLAQSDRTRQIIQTLHEGKAAEAKQLADAALGQSPSSAALWALRGLACLRLDNKEDALRSFKQALALNPDYPAALEGAAELEYAKGSQEAVPLLERLVRMRPADPTSHAMLASLAFARRDCRTALGEFALSHPLIDTRAAALQREGVCLMKTGQAKAAVPVFEQLLQLQPADGKARYNLAVVQSLAGENSDVVNTLGPLTAGQSPDADALDLCAEAYEAKGNTPKAVESLRRAIVLKPDVAEYYVDFANISLVHNAYGVGVDVLSVGLKHLPNAAPLYLARGILYVYLGEYEKSEADFAKAELLDRHNGDASAALGLAALQTSDLPKAEAVLRSRIEKQPGNAFLYYLLGETLVKKGAATGSQEFQEAQRAARKAVEIDPGLVVARDLLGRLYLQQGDVEKAIEESRRAVRDNPSDQGALYHLILALKRAGRGGEVPELTQRLAQLRTAARQKESEEHRFSLVEGGVGGSTR